MIEIINIPNEVIFSVLRTLKHANPGDTYYENYLWHYNKRKEKFFDIYHFAWSRALTHKPKRILEIGTRTGLSLAQLLSGYMDTSIIEKIVCCDIFADGYTSPELVQYNLRVLGIPEETIKKIEFKVGDSKVEIPKLVENIFDYILVDGSHDPNDAKTDLENVKSLVSQGGVIVFDDIDKDGMDLAPVWHEFMNKYKDEFEWFENYDGKGIGLAVKL
jgi:predicted O-methyltransferase YrrM